MMYPLMESDPEVSEAVSVLADEIQRTIDAEIIENYTKDMNSYLDYT